METLKIERHLDLLLDHDRTVSVAVYYGMGFALPCLLWALSLTKVTPSLVNFLLRNQKTIIISISLSPA